MPFKISPHIDRALAAAVPAWRDHGCYDRPFGVGQITRIRKPLRCAAKRCSGFHIGRSPENQAPSNESHPIHQTQELPGSALTLEASVSTLTECKKIVGIGISYLRLRDILIRPVSVVMTDGHPHTEGIARNVSKGI
jgi:hypothetical protein